MNKFSNIKTILHKELSAYFNSAVAYIYIIVFALLSGGLFMTQFFLIGRADMRPYFLSVPFLLVVFLPALTMRLWAEERKGNTLELLLTFPVKPHDLVLGKFLAAYLFYLAALAATFPVPVMVCILGRPDFGMILSGYIGSALLGAFYIALGIFISGLCLDQVVAFILSMMASFCFYLLGTEFLATTIDGWIPGFGTFLRFFIGTARHFESFVKGIIDNRDILYFLIGSVLFLVLNGFWLEGRMRPKAKAIFSGAVLISLGIFLTSNWFFGTFPLGRFDLTEGKIYTVSPASRQILRGLKVPVTVKFYVSPTEKMPTGMKTLEQDVVAIFDEFHNVAGGNFQYKIFHLEASGAFEKENTKEGKDAGSMEGKLAAKGIEPFRVQSVETDEVGVRLVYSAISISYKEKPEEILPQIMPDLLSELEYLIISKIYRMTLPGVPKIALVAPYKDKSVDPQLQMLLAQLGGGDMPGTFREDNYEILQSALKYEGYDVARIRLNKEEPIPAKTKTLAVIEPENLSERQKYEISRFLAAGGSVLLAVQNYQYDYVPEGGKIQITPVRKNPNINSLLEGWGVMISDDVLMDAQNEMITIGGGPLGIFEMSVPVKLPTQIVVRPDNMNKDISITSRLSSLFYLWGSALKIDSDKLIKNGVKCQVLFKSSPDAWMMPLPNGVFGPAKLFLSQPQKGNSFPLAVFAEGKFPDVYEGKNMPSWTAPDEKQITEGEEKNSKEPEEIQSMVNPASGKLLLLGDAAMFQKQLIRGGGHLNFFLNAIDALSLGDELIQIRSKQPVDRTLRRVSSAEKLIWKFVTAAVIPILIAMLGIGRVFLRKRAKQKYLQAIGITA